MINIEINILNSFYKNKKGIKNINLKIENGDFISLFGNNGAEKTTLLNTLVGIKYFEDKINIDYKYNQIASVSQKQVIDWYLSVRDNIRDFIVNVVLLPIYFSAPAYYILKDINGYIKIIAYLNPLTYQLNVLRADMLFLNFNKDVLILIMM